MNREALIDRLGRYEWSDLEFKEARNAVPRTAYEAVSAFANGSGGRLVFGVRDHDGDLEIVGVSKVDKVQSEFLSVLRSGQKLNRPIGVGADVIEADGKSLLIFSVPESPRSEKPVYLDGDIRRSFIRRGGCNERCTRREVERLLRDASVDRYDDQPLVRLDAEEFYDPRSVRWYQRRYFDRNPGKNEAVSDLEFLDEWGFVVDHDDRLVPTRAGVLLFGRPRYVRQTLPRPVIDLQFIHSAFDDWTTDLRWHDRVVIEENLIQAWLSVSERYWKHSDRPFRLDVQTLRRNDHPPDYIAFREAAINQLIHQDYGDHGRKASIRVFRDRNVFWNPGDAFATTDELLDPTEKEVRNPSVVAAFRRIGLSEQAGTGIRAVFRNWRSLGYVPPAIDNDKPKKSFRLLLVREELVDEDQRRFQASLGLRLDDGQAALFALVRRKRRVSVTDAKAVTGRPGPQAREVLRSLTIHGLVRPLGESGRYELANHIAESSEADRSDQSGGEGAGGSAGSASDAAGVNRPDLISDHVDRPGSDLISDHVVATLTDRQREIIEACDVPRSRAELMERAGLTHRVFFSRKHLNPLVSAGLVRLTNPDHPRAANQRYVLTEAGVALKASWMARERDE